MKILLEKLIYIPLVSNFELGNLCKYLSKNTLLWRIFQRCGSSFSQMVRELSEMVENALNPALYRYFASAQKATKEIIEKIFKLWRE